MQKCYLDLDGVLVELNESLCNLHGDNPYQRPTGIGEQSLEMLLGVSAQELWSKSDASWWAGLPWTSDGEEILRIVEYYFGVANVCLLTRPLPYEIDEGQSVLGKLRWVHNNLPRYDNRVLVGAAKEFCAGSIEHTLIDDTDVNTEQFTLHGGRAFLVPRIWNTRHRRRGEVLETLNKFLKSL